MINFEKDFAVKGSVLIACMQKTLEFKFVTDEPNEGCVSIKAEDIQADVLYRLVIHAVDVFRVSEVQIVETLESLELWL
jgi:hypothetical protein